MAYIKQMWHNRNTGTKTPISAERLNYMEDGIEAAHNLAEAESTGTLTGLSDVAMPATPVPGTFLEYDGTNFTLGTPDAGPTALVNLDDVEMPATPVDGTYLRYGTASGTFTLATITDIVGATSLDELSDVDVTTTAPTDGQTLTFNAGTWTPATPSGVAVLAWDTVNFTTAPIASGVDALSIGDGAVSSGTESLSVGFLAKTNATNQSVAIGPRSNTSGSYAVAVGYYASATAFGTAIGYNTGVSGSYAVALGANSAAGGDSAVAVGRSAVSNGASSVAVGQLASTGTLINAVAIGGAASVTGAGAVSVGYSTSAIANATAIGYDATASGTKSIAIGDTASAGAYSIAVGAFADAPNTATVYIGSAGSGTVNTTGSYNVAIGFNCMIADRAVAVGDQVQATGQYSIGLGSLAFVSSAGTSGIAIGRDVDVTHPGSVAIGRDHGPAADGVSPTSAASTAANQIMLGTINHDVVVPGSLTVDGTAITGKTLNRETLDATPVQLTSANGQLIVPASTAYQIKISGVARRTDVQGEMAAWTWEGLVGRDATGNARIIGAPVQAAWGDAPATDTWNLAVSIDTTDATNNYVAVTATGEAAKTIRWVAKMEWVEVSG